MPSPGRAGGKLSLKRKKPLEPGGEGAALPGWPPLYASSNSQFQKQRPSNAEGAWMTLLRAAEPHLNQLSLEKTASLPVFPTKRSQTATLQEKPETFNVGMKEFQWVPYPLYHREDAKGNNSGRLQNSENETASVKERENDEDERPKVISPVPERKSSTATEHSSEVSEMNYGIKYSTQLERGERFQIRQHTHSQKSPEYSSLTPAQSHLKEFEKLQKRCSVQDEVENRRENGREIPSNNDTHVQHGTLFNEATSTLPAWEPSSASFSSQGKTENHNEEIPTLEKCPLCQMPFPGIWSELAVDNHLARCLSQSADDVVW